MLFADISLHFEGWRFVACCPGHASTAAFKTLIFNCVWKVQYYSNVLEVLLGDVNSLVIGRNYFLAFCVLMLLVGHKVIRYVKIQFPRENLGDIFENGQIALLPVNKSHSPSMLWHCWLGGRKGIQPVKSWGGDGGGGHWLVRMECRPARWSVSASVNLSLNYKAQKFSSGTGSPGWSRKKGS